MSGAKWLALKSWLGETALAVIPQSDKFITKGDRWNEYRRQHGLTGGKDAVTGKPEGMLWYLECCCDQDDCSESNEDVASRLDKPTTSWASTRSQLKTKLEELGCPQNLLPRNNRGQGRKGKFHQDDGFAGVLNDLDD